MRTHNSDKLLCDGMAEREKLDGKRIEIERERESKRNQEQRKEFNFIDTTLYYAPPVCRTHWKERQFP